ncbi:uncharacterized protein FIBRA_05782 [Fibroporia radiculosa]|uniref:Uncharacterized protein n=1 Tax=Fibroporia radiculosa TaxID=599839 RepID=J4GA34_9APHY|nr:uncharacterized protein FIBRA_05782 [Fibroporia radiculosa]CCM03638.1 predicted protein [Fibroporia radiculosa]
MSALSEASTPAQDAAPPSIDTQHLHQGPLHPDLHHQQALQNGSVSAPVSDNGRKRESPVLPVSLAVAQPLDPSKGASCLKRGLGAQCAYPDPEADHTQNQPQPPAQVPFAPPPMYPPPAMHNLGQPPHYYEYNNTFAGASTSTFRPNKRPRNLTEEEAAAITRNFTRGDFFVGSSAPVRIDPRLPVRLTLAEGDQQSRICISVTRTLFSYLLLCNACVVFGRFPLH